MPSPDQDATVSTPIVSRRDALKRVAVLGAVAGLPATRSAVAQSSSATNSHPSTAPRAREALEALTATEGEILEAIVARLIPTDENGSGATEARAAHYIDRALTGPLARWRSRYANGLAATDAHARTVRGKRFVELTAPEQDSVLRDIEEDRASGFFPSAREFFDLVRSHTIEGTFCDPYYGGNANFVGWDLVGYPGIRLGVGPEEQQMGSYPPPERRSAYDLDQFAKGGKPHGH